MDPFIPGTPGMLPRAGLLQQREAYGRYAADVMTRGGQPMPFEQWVRVSGPLTPVGAQVGQRAAPAGTIEERLLAKEKAELEARRAAEAAAMRQRAIAARSGSVVR